MEDVEKERTDRMEYKYTESMLSLLSEAEEFLARSAETKNTGGIPEVSVGDVLDKLTVPNENPVVISAEVRCPYAKNKDAKVKVMASALSGDERNGGLGLRETDIKLVPNTFGICKLSMGPCLPAILGSRWKGCDVGNLIGGQPSVNMSSYMICSIGGLITLKTNGQRAGSGRMVYDGHDFTRLIGLIKNFEVDPDSSTYIRDENKKPIAIDIQNVGDGCITIGYGHILQTEEEIEKYGFGEWKEEILANVAARNAKKEINELPYSIEVIQDIIDKQKAKMERDGMDNPAILSVSDAEEILLEDIKNSYSTAKEIGEGFSDNQIDALTSNIFSAGAKEKDSSDSFLFYLVYFGQEKEINHESTMIDQESAMEIIKTAKNSGWYKGQEGLFRRRLMEYNMYFNGKYDYYSHQQLEELKKAVNYID